MIPIPRAGILEEVRGQERCAVPGIARLELRARRGYVPGDSGSGGGTEIRSEAGASSP